MATGDDEMAGAGLEDVEETEGEFSGPGLAEAGGADSGSGGAGAIGGIYSKIEDGFFALMDAVQARGVPVYSVIDPLEARGIPVFPVTVALAVVLAFLVYGMMFGTPAKIMMDFTITDAEGDGLSTVNVTVKDSHGGLVLSSVLSNGDSVTLPGALFGSSVSVQGSRQGYGEATDEIILNNTSVNARLALGGEAETIIGTIRLVDAKTKGAIASAIVTAEMKGGNTVNCFYDAGGIVECRGVPEGEEIILKIEASNYEDKTFSTGLYEEPIEIALTPKAGASSGTSVLIIRAKDEDSGLPIYGAAVRVYDSLTDMLITEEVFDAEYSGEIAKGTAVRVVVEAEGYEMYDSTSAGESRTMRNEEEIFSANLRKGGTVLEISVINEGNGVLLPGATVMLFSREYELLGQEETEFGGNVEFSGLEAGAEYYATAYKNGYLPNRIVARPADGKEYEIKVAKVSVTNSAPVEVTVEDSFGDIGNDAALNFYETVNEENLPLGIPLQRADFFGKYTTFVQMEKQIYVEATKGVESGSGSVTVKDSIGNQIFITMERPEGVVLLTLTDGEHEISEGNVLLMSGGGDVLFDGEYAEGGIEFVAAGNKFVKLTYTYPDGKTFKEEINVEGVSKADVAINREGVSASAPVIEFGGVFDASGRKVEGLAKGRDYYLKFSLELPEGDYRSGVHIRLGADDVKYADSMDAGIIGFSVVGAEHRYGRTYSPVPAPGFEGIDYANQGREGKHNKWLELYFKSGGAKVVKVRVKAKETAAADSIELHYRAWTEMSGTYYRDPVDEVIGEARGSAERSGLYAEAKTENIKIFEELPECENELCASYRFVRDTGAEFEPAEFKPVKGGKYALEIELNPREDASVTIRGSTAKAAPKIAFLGYAINNFAEFPDTNSTDTSIEAKDISLVKDRAVKVRLYFKVLEAGNTHITSQVITQKTSLSESFYFNAYVERELSVTVQPSFVEMGKGFEVIVKGAAGESVENAVLEFRNTYKELLRVVRGNMSSGNGADGRYKIDNSFDAGEIELGVSAEDYKPVVTGIEIGMGGVLQLPDEVRIIIPKGSGSGNARVALDNLSEHMIENIKFEIKKKNVPQGMEITVDPVSYLAADSTHYVTFNAEYHGEEDRVQAGAEAIAKAEVLGKYPVRATTNIIVDYNPKLEAECLELSKEEIIVWLEGGQDKQQYYNRMYDSGQYATQDYMNYAQGQTEDYYSRYGQSNYNPYDDSLYRYNAYSENAEVKVTLKNNCELELVLSPEVLGSDDEYITVDIDDEIVLQPAGSESAGRRLDEKEIGIRVTNNVLRNYAEKEKYEFDIFFRSDALTRQVPLEVHIWNPFYALEINRNIELWIAQGGDGKSGQMAQAAAPLFVRNAGHADIQNLSFAISSSSSRGSTTARIEPQRAIPVLKVGQVIQPPPIVVVTALRNEKATLLDVIKLNVRGTINGKSYDFGQVIVNARVSPPGCVEITPGEFSLSSTKCEEGALSRDITIMNQCAEEVIIRGISPQAIGGNEISLSGGGAIPAGASTTAKLIITKRQCYSGAPMQIVLKGILPHSQRWVDSNPVTLDVEIGKTAGKAEAASRATSIKVCNDAGKSESRVFDLPVIASGADCTNAYCDAQQMAQFLGDIIDGKIRDVKRQVASYKADVHSSPCRTEAAKGYCNFENLGVGSRDIEVFLQNDSLSDRMLESEFKKRNSELKGFSADYISPGAQAGHMLGSFGNMVFLNDEFRGCGRYVVNIKGAVKVQGTRLLPGQMAIVIDLQREEGEPREVTEQCMPKIQNVMNFLPMDKGYGLNPDTSMGSWLGVVVTDEDGFETLGEDVAQEVFGDKKRFLDAGGSGTNRIDIKKGVEESYIVKVEMVNAGDAEPVTVTASVKQAAGEKARDVAKEAAKAIKGLAGGAIDGCISSEEQGNYVLLKAATGFEDLEIGKCVSPAGDDAINVSYGEAGCCEFKILGVLSETVKVDAKLSPLDARGTGKPWVALKGKVAEGRGKDYAEAKLEKVEKDKDGKETGKYYAEMMLCVEGTENLQLAVGNKAVLNATTKGLEKRQNDAKTREVELNVCGIHPLNAKQKAKELKIGETRYAMLAWEGGPESITLRELYNATEAAKLTEELRKKVLNRDSSAIVDPDAKRRQEAILTGYLPACAVSSAAMGLLTKGPWGIITDPTVYCGIPAAMAWAAQTGWGAEFKGIIYKYVDDIKEISPPQMRGALEGIESYLKGPSVFELGATDKEVNDLKVSVGATIAGNASYRLISQGGASLKSWKWKDFFGKGILGGLIKGAVPNAVGLYFYEKRFKQLEGKYKVDNKNPQVQGKTTEMYDIDGDGKKETPIRVEGYETVLEKYHTYKVWRENKGFYIGEFFEESVIPAKAKKEEIWCDAGSIDKPITSAKAGIFPNANSPPAGVGTIEHYTASYNYLAKYADVMRNAAGEKVPEALLVTVAIWKGGLENEQPTKDWITGCEKGSEGSRSDKDSFECAAGQLAGYIGNCGGLETEGKFTCVMKNYNNKDSEGRNAYTAMGGSGMTYSKLYGIFTTWNEYQPLKIEVAG